MVNLGAELHRSLSLSCVYTRKLTRRSLIGRGAASPVAGQSAWATVRFSIYFSGRRSGGGGRTDWRANLCVASTGGEQDRLPS